MLSLPTFDAALGEFATHPHAFPDIRRWFKERHGYGAEIVLLLAPFWQQPITTWVAPEGRDFRLETESLLHHLFLKYPVPAPLFETHWGGEGNLKWLTWMLLLGQGVSLQRAGRLFGWAIPRGFVKRFEEAPPDLDPREACLWAEIEGLGGSKIEFDRLIGYFRWHFDPTDISNEHQARQWRECWRETVRWLITHREQLDDTICRSILDWAEREQVFSLCYGGQFELSQFTPRRVLDRAMETRDDKLLDPVWKHHGWDWEHVHEGRCWTVRELLTAKELGKEGDYMYHCVSRYSHDCSVGRSAIFSLARDGCELLTLEVCMFRKRVVQARGTHNRPPTPEEREIVKLWNATLPGSR